MARRAKDAQAASEMLRHQVDLLRVEAGARTDVIRALDEMINELSTMVRSQDLTDAGKKRVDQLLTSAADTIDRYYRDISDGMGGVLGGVSRSAARNASDTLERTLIAADVSANLPTATYLERAAGNAMIMGAQSAEWWERQSDDAQFRFAAAVRQGMVAGETSEQIARRVGGTKTEPGALEILKSNARSLVHTSIMEVANESRMETFKKNSDVVEGVRQVSTLDSNTTDVCIAYDGAEWDLSGEGINTDLPFDGGPPRHWGCRSVLVPITKTFRELGIDAPEPGPGERASPDGPVPGDMTFGDWLETQTKEQQDEILGQGRAELWRDGKITLTQLLDLRGNPLTLGELEAKYGDHEITDVTRAQVEQAKGRLEEVLKEKGNTDRNFRTEDVFEGGAERGGPGVNRPEDLASGRYLQFDPAGDNVVATQNFVGTQKVLDFITTPPEDWALIAPPPGTIYDLMANDVAGRGGGTEGVPVVIFNRNGKSYIVDGHHRAAAAALLRIKVKAYVVDE